MLNLDAKKEDDSSNERDKPAPKEVAENPFASRRKEISTEKDAADNEFEDRPRPTSNNLKDHWPKIIYCIFILFLANNLEQLKKDENGIGVYSKNKASSNFTSPTTT